MKQQKYIVLTGWKEQVKILGYCHDGFSLVIPNPFYIKNYAYSPFARNPIKVIKLRGIAKAQKLCNQLNNQKGGKSKLPKSFI